MADGPIHQPHDKLVKSTFSDPENTRAFLQAHLPPDLAAHIDWPSLRLANGTFIDPEFAASSSDLLFTATIHARPALLYILFEHQNRQDPLIALRLLTYMVRIWHHHLRAHPGSTNLPPILPLVLAQDNKPWKTSTRFADLVSLPGPTAAALEKYLPDFEFQLIELFRMPFDKILGTPMGILTLRALKADKLHSLLDDPVWDEALLIQLPATSFEMLMRYILDRDLDKPAFHRKLQSIRNPNLSKNAMSLAEQFRQEGFVQANQRAVIGALEVRFGHVPEGLREEIEAITSSQKLTQLHRAAITSPDLEAFASTI